MSGPYGFEGFVDIKISIPDVEQYYFYNPKTDNYNRQSMKDYIDMLKQEDDYKKFPSQTSNIISSREEQMLKLWHQRYDIVYKYESGQLDKNITNNQNNYNPKFSNVGVKRMRDFHLDRNSEPPHKVRNY